MPHGVTKRSESKADERAASAEELLKQAQWLAEGEDARASSFAQRASWALGFCGVLAGLVAAQGREMLAQSAELNANGRFAATCSLAVCLLALVVSSLFAVSALWPRPTVAISDDEVDRFNGEEWMSRTRASHQVRMTEALAKRIRIDRISNRRRSRSVLGAYIALVFAISALAFHVGVFAIDAANGREDDATTNSLA